MTARPWLRIALISAAPLALLIALGTGSVALKPETLWQVMTGAEQGLPHTLVYELRLPRALAAFAVGGLLALSGTLLQALLRNPLADPYILGISGGAAVASLASILAGLGSAWVSGNALLGGFIVMLLVFGLSHGRGSWTETRLLLTGVVLAMGCGAVVSLMLALSPEAQLASLIFWLLGDIGHTSSPGIALVTLAAGLAMALPFARALNLYARGERVAAALGENIALLRYGIYFLASLLTAAAVTVAGPIGFVGLVIPHLLRQLGCTDHRQLLIDAPLAGGILLTLADTVARTLLAPAQLPVGVITALLGVPVFLVLLVRGRRQPA